MPERTRAYWRDELVTVLERPKKKRGGKATIRDKFGHVHEISAKDLTEIDPSEPHAKFSYGATD